MVTGSSMVLVPAVLAFVGGHFLMGGIPVLAVGGTMAIDATQ